MRVLFIELINVLTLINKKRSNWGILNCNQTDIAIQFFLLSENMTFSKNMTFPKIFWGHFFAAKVY